MLINAVCRLLRNVWDQIMYYTVAFCQFFFHRGGWLMWRRSPNTIYVALVMFIEWHLNWPDFISRKNVEVASANGLLFLLLNGIFYALVIGSYQHDKERRKKTSPNMVANWARVLPFRYNVQLMYNDWCLWLPFDQRVETWGNNKFAYLIDPLILINGRVKWMRNVAIGEHDR